MLHDDRRPGPAAAPVHLLPLHRQEDSRAVLIAGDDLEPGPEQIVVRMRGELAVGAGGGADDQLLLHRLSDRLDAGRVPGHADVDLAVEVADPPQRGRIVVGADETKQRRLDHSALDSADGQAVARRDLGDEAGRPQAAGARHVLHDECGIAGNETAEMAGKKTRIGVEAARRPGRDHDLDRLPAKERLDGGLRRGRRRGEHRCESGDADGPCCKRPRHCRVPPRGAVYLAVNSLIISGIGSNPRPGVSGSVTQSLSSCGMPVKIASQVFTAAV